MLKGWLEDLSRIFLEHPDWNAAEMRRFLIKKRGEPETPGLSAVQKQLAAMRLKYKGAMEELDNPWNMGTLEKHKLSPEAIVEVLATQQWGRENGKEQLTIQQAKWVSHLRGVADLLRAGNGELDVAKWLWEWSEAYAQYEIICHLAGKPVDTSTLDEGVWGGAWPMTANNAVIVAYPKSRKIDIATHDKKLKGDAK